MVSKVLRGKPMKLIIRVEIYNQSLIYWVNAHHMDWYNSGSNPDKKILFNKFSDIREYFIKHYMYHTF